MENSISKENCMVCKASVDLSLNEEELEELRLVKQHRKRLHPLKYKIPVDAWEDCLIESVERLPHDTDGTKVYSLPFDPKCRTKSSKEGSNWVTWKTSSRVGFEGVRRVANCNKFTS